MAHNTTVFRQLLDLLPRHEFDAEARQHQEGQRLRVMSRWAQFVALGLGQLGGLQSLRDIVGNLSAQPHKLYHLGRASVRQSNAQQPYTLKRSSDACWPAANAAWLPVQEQAVRGGRVESTCAWRPVGVVPAHERRDQAEIGPGGTSADQRDRRQDRRRHGGPHVDVPAGSVVVADRAYLDFGWLHQLQQRGVTFVTRLKRNVRYQVVREHDVDIRTGVLSDQTIELTSARSRKAYPGTLRRVGYWDEETRRSYVFVTNNTTWVGKTIANLYKSRWQIELFFKWIKQHLKVKRFVGRTKNAVLSQLWVATCMYLLLAYLKFVLRLSWSLHQMLRVLQLNLFDRRPLVELFTTPSPPGSPDPQMLLWR